MDGWMDGRMDAWMDGRMDRDRQTKHNRNKCDLTNNSGRMTDLKNDNDGQIAFEDEPGLIFKYPNAFCSYY